MKNIIIVVFSIFLLATFFKVQAASPTIRCVVQSKTEVFKIDLDSSNFSKEKKLSIDKFLLRFHLIYKFGDYDTYPNVVLTLEESGKLISETIFVGNNDEYGTFRFGTKLENHGRCDILE